MGGRILLTAYPSLRVAKKEAQRVVAAGLAACANILQVSSLYKWKGALERAEEHLVIFKTTEQGLDGLRRSILERHPYEVPEAIELIPASINESYLSWLVESVIVESVAVKKDC